MAAKRFQLSLGDFVAIGIAPAFIMTLIGSLVFFLVEVVYRGQYNDRLCYVFGWYVFAAVLVARLSIERGLAVAVGYGAALMAAAWMVLNVFADYKGNAALAVLAPLVNVGLLGLVQWCAHKLTWDCTYVNDDEDASGAGLLDAAGLDEGGAELPPEEGDQRAREAPGLWARLGKWWEERKKRPHTPGVWVVYFSLAALPLFGLGQLSLAGKPEAQRSYLVYLLATYVASGLALLLTTTYLGLRRYLRQRKLQMPAAMTGVWLAMGGGLILALLAVGFVLPRPTPGKSFANWMNFAGSKDQKASKNAVLKDGSAGKGEGAASPKAKGDPDAKAGQGAQGDPKGGQVRSGQNPTQGGGNQNSPNGQGQKSGQDGQAGGQGKQPNRERGNNKDGQKDQNGQQGKDQDQQNRGKQPNGGPNQPSDQKNQGPQNRDQDPQNQGQKNAGDQRDQASSDPAASEKGNEDESNTSEGSEGSPPNFMEQHPELGWLTEILHWGGMILLGVIAVGALIWALRRWRDLLAWLQGLFGGKKEEKGGAGAAAAAAEARPEPPPPFADFSNPFLDGRAERMAPAHLVRYTYAALEAWAHENGLGRQPEQTPLEFAEHLGGQLPRLEAEARRAVQLYGQVAYGRGGVPANAPEALRTLWQKLTARPAAERAAGPR